MARDHHVRPVALDPLHQLGVAEIALAAPTGRRVRGWRMMHPDPPLGASCRRSTQLRVDALPQQRAVPPWADREQRIADREIITVAGDAELAHLADPARVFLAFGVALVEIVIAGA